MITTIEEAITFLQSEEVQSMMVTRFVIHREGSLYIAYGHGVPMRSMSMAELLEEANRESLVLQRRANIERWTGDLDVINVAKLSNNLYHAVWFYRHQGQQNVWPFEPDGPRKILHVLEILTNRGYPVDPPDMIDQLKAAIVQEEEDDRTYFESKYPE